MYENSFTLKRMFAAYGKPFRFTGRSTRTELLGYLILFWLLTTALGWLAIALGFALSVSVDTRSFMTIDLANLLLWLPLPALAVRRFHDQDRPGLWAFPLIIPTVLSWVGGENALNQTARVLVGLFYLVALVLLFWKPTDGTNRYGPDPRLDADDWKPEPKSSQAG